MKQNILVKNHTRAVAFTCTIVTLSVRKMGGNLGGGLPWRRRHVA